MPHTAQWHLEATFDSNFRIFSPTPFLKKAEIIFKVDMGLSLLYYSADHKPFIVLYQMLLLLICAASNTFERNIFKYWRCLKSSIYKSQHFRLLWDTGMLTENVVSYLLFCLFINSEGHILDRDSTDYTTLLMTVQRYIIYWSDWSPAFPCCKQVPGGSQ